MENAIKSECDEIEIKENISTDFKPEYAELTELKCSVSEPASEPVFDSIKVKIQNSNPGDYNSAVHTVKSESDEIEVKQTISAIDLKTEYRELKCTVSEPTSEPVFDSFKIVTENSNLVDYNSAVHTVKSECDEIEVKQNISAIDLIPEYAELKCTASEPTSELTLLVPISDSIEINSQNINPCEEYNVPEPMVKSECNEIEAKEPISSIFFKPQYSKHKCIFSEPVNDPLSLVFDSIEIKSQNTSYPSEDFNFAGHVVKSEYDEINCNAENIISVDFKSRYIESKDTAAEATRQPISLVIDSIPTCENTTQNADPFENSNVVKAPNVLDRIETPVSYQRISEAFTINRNSNKEHWLKHSKEQSVSDEFCTQSVSEEIKIKTQKVIYMKEKFVCVVCHKSFPQKSHLVKHRRTHTGEKFFSCDVCTKLFSDRSNFKRHMITHNGEKYFSCDVCTKGFSQKCNLKVHLLIHTGEKSFSCDVCTKAFYRKSQLEVHMLTHTREKYFSCDVCTKTFYRKEKLKAHLITHTGEKPFSCDVCTMAFSRKNVLKVHMLTHTGEKNFTCDVCTKAFSRKYDLKVHLITHTGEKSFSCDVCTKAYFRKGDLKMHMLTHTGEKYFSCDVCTKAFYRKDKLKVHLLTHTEGKCIS